VPGYTFMLCLARLRFGGSSMNELQMSRSYRMNLRCGRWRTSCSSFIKSCAVPIFAISIWKTKRCRVWALLIANYETARNGFVKSALPSHRIPIVRMETFSAVKPCLRIRCVNRIIFFLLLSHTLLYRVFSFLIPSALEDGTPGKAWHTLTFICS